jgi:peptidoglycan/xylan/chitin deacetylase (PgdA/CDA1 family)
MSPTADPIPRARKPWSWLAGILVLGVLGGGVVAVSLLLWDYIDIQAVTRAPQTEVMGAALPLPAAPAPAARPAGTAFPAHVYHSEASAGYFPDPEYYPSLVEEWEGRLADAGGRVERIGSADELRALEGEGTVAAPAAICLSDDEIDALHEHVEAGGGLVLTWATAARDEGCEWRGWSALRELARALDVRQVETRPGVYMTVPAGLPLSQGIEPAARVELRWDAQVALAVEGPRAYWSDWALNPAPAEEAEGVDAAAHLASAAGGGRVVWFGFSGGEGATPLDEARVETMLRNGVWWAAGVPSAEILPWPGGRRAAFVLTQQVGWEFENARNLAELARTRELPVTFFAASRRALDHPELAEALAAAGEVASQGADDQPVAGLPLTDQRGRLDQSRAQIRGWTGAEATGLRPPEERFDANTLEAWRALGGSYVVGINNGRTGSAEVLETAAGPVVLLPRVLKDDYNVLVQDRTMREDDLVRAFEQGLQKLRVLGGVGVLTTHSQLAGAPRHIGAVARVLDGVRAQGEWWPATGREVAEWVLARREAEVGLVPSLEEEGAWRVEVTAPADAALSGAWIKVHLPRGGPWEPWVGGEPVEFAGTEWGIAVEVRDLAPGERWTMDLRRNGEATVGGGAWGI